MKPTLKDVAAEAGVSLSAASYVLSKTGLHKVSLETQKRILAAARQLHYTPNVMARGLRQGRSACIGVMVPYINSSFIPEIIAGIDDVLTDNDYNMMLCTYESEEEFTRKCRSLLRRQVDGILLKPMNETIPSQLEGLLGPDLPCVIIAHPEMEGYPGVCVDPEAIGILAAENLLRKNHRQIFADDRMHPRGLKAMTETFLAAGALPPILKSMQSDDDIRQLLLTREKISAIVALDPTAMKVIRTAGTLKIRIPEELSVLGIDGMDFGAYSIPALTSISQPRKEQGQIAAQLLLNWIIQHNRPFPKILLPQLCLRDSLGIREQ